MDLLRTLAAAIVIFTDATVAIADCSDIPQASSQEDRTLLWLKDGSWHPVRQLNADLAAGEIRTITFAYIIQDEKDAPTRRGIVVVKSGSRLRARSVEGANKVVLYRPRIADRCRNKPFPEMNGKVEVHNYDSYHDSNIKTNEYKTLREFHVRYDSRRGCKWSDDNSSDEVSWRSRSNRSQFSFDPDVVANGQHSFVSTLFGARKSFAGEMIRPRKAEIRKYQVNEEGTACVRFSVKIEPGAFVRVNDLESRTIFRTDGAVWNRK
jgi:hypothetical protein